MTGERRIVVDGCFNVRDVGGYETQDGKRTRWRALLRSDDLCGLTPDGLATFKTLGVRSIIDVRGLEEAALAPHPFGPAGADVDGVGYWHWPLRDPADVALERAVQDAPNMVEMYRLYLQHCAPRIAAIVRGFVEAPAGGVLIHCQVGKDRTGVTVALMLAAASPPRRSSRTTPSARGISDRCTRRGWRPGGSARGTRGARSPRPCGSCWPMWNTSTAAPDSTCSVVG